MNVLLVGEQWDLLASSLAALKRTGNIAFVGPTAENLRKLMARCSPSLVLVSGDFDYAGLARLKRETNGDSPIPPFLLCITHEVLEGDDLYDGVDDFLVVPCSVSELDKRMRRLAVRGPAPPPSSVLTIGSLSMDLVNYRVSVDGSPVRLAWMEFQLLKFLMQNPGRVFSRQELLNRVWNTQHYGNTRTVDVHIRRLRFKLGAIASDYLRTVTNVGYGIVLP